MIIVGKASGLDGPFSGCPLFIESTQMWAGVSRLASWADNAGHTLYNTCRRPYLDSSQPPVPPTPHMSRHQLKFEHRLVLALNICQLYEKEAKCQRCNVRYGEMHWHIAFSFPKNPKINITTLHAPGSHWHPSKNWPCTNAHKRPTLSLAIAHKG